MLLQLTEAQRHIVATIREFVEKEVKPVANRLDNADIYPHELVNRMRDLGLFGVLVPEEYGGLGLDYTTFALIMEELCRGWMSLSGVIGTHHILVHMLVHNGTEAQRREYLPKLAAGELRGGLALTEAGGGSDVAGAMKTVAKRDGDWYVINGSKMWITNAEHGNAFALVCKTDPKAEPAHRGISAFVALKDHPGFKVMRHIEKLGYRSIDTCELVFEDYVVPADRLIGGVEGKGFAQVMSGLEGGRINVAARAVGVAQAAFEAAIRYAQQRYAFGKPIAEHQEIQMKLADMATKIEAARLLVFNAAAIKDRGGRVDMEAGMAKVFASEMCMQVTLDAMRVFGGYGYAKENDVERYFRDAPLMIIGEGTNEIQNLVIARNLLKRYAI
ncbi:MAG: acyl-CoA dehydrogenase family protein [Dehalococcoidia bacterium]|nr:acyl-CoA dehydrogenase family protein [Dehalococcoidia bacterium]